MLSYKYRYECGHQCNFNMVKEIDCTTFVAINCLINGK